MSPADDILIQVERSLDIDSEGQMVASILSKKVAAGSTHVVIDMPVGETAKVRSQDAVDSLSETFESVADAIGLNLEILPGEGTQPIGQGIGPALEARDVLQVLRNEDDAPDDLRERSLQLAGGLLELTDRVEEGRGKDLAEQTLESGSAWQKFQAICHAQGRFSEPPSPEFTQEITADRSGIVVRVDNRKLARVAKLAGAPRDAAVGVDYLVRIDESIEKGDCLYEVHADSRGELDYALTYADNTSDIIEVEEPS